jgi:hypothetical protein
MQGFLREDGKFLSNSLQFFLKEFHIFRRQRIDVP